MKGCFIGLQFDSSASSFHMMGRDDKHSFLKSSVLWAESESVQVLEHEEQAVAIVNRMHEIQFSLGFLLFKIQNVKLLEEGWVWAA